MDPTERADLMRDLRTPLPEHRLVYVTPEFLNQSESFKNILKVCLADVRDGSVSMRLSWLLF